MRIVWCGGIKIPTSIFGNRKNKSHGLRHLLDNVFHNLITKVKNSTNLVVRRAFQDLLILAFVVDVGTKMQTVSNEIKRDKRQRQRMGGYVSKSGYDVCPFYKCFSPP